MQLISFDALRTLEMNSAEYLKPERMYAELKRVRAADWVLFPEYWQVNTLVYALHKRIFPSINSYHLGHDKVEMTRALLAVCPAHVPHTSILPSTPAAVEQIMEEHYFPLVAKEPRNSMGRGVHLLADAKALRMYAQANEVLYVQEYLDILRDLRVVWVGDRAVAAYWRVGAEGSFHNNVAQGGALDFENIPAAALELVARVARALGIDHAGFDLAEVDGHYYFLEFNVLFGNQGLNERGLHLAPLIEAYLRRRMEAGA